MFKFSYSNMSVFGFVLLRNKKMIIIWYNENNSVNIRIVLTVVMFSDCDIATVVRNEENLFIFKYM